MAPRSFPRSTKWVPGSPGDLVLKSKLSLRSGSLALKHLNPIQKRSRSFFWNKSLKLNMTDWPCHIWLQKKLVWPTNKAALEVCYRRLCAKLLMGFCVLYLHTIMVFISNGQHMLWSQKVCRKCIFQRSGDPNLLT